MSAEEQKVDASEAAPAVESSTSNGEQPEKASEEKAEESGANGSAEAMDVDAEQPAAVEKKEEDGGADADAKKDESDKKEEDETPAAPAPENQEGGKPASKSAPKESKPASTSSRQTRPKPESAKPVSAKPASAAGEKKVARPRSSLPAGGSGKGKTGSAAAGADRSYEPGDIVLGRLKGYPPWPARITSPDELPQNVLKQRPGKSSSIYCVQYFPAGDYSWLPTREITPLPASDIDAWLGEKHRKATGALRVAYETAQDPSEWDASQAQARAAQLDDEEDEDEDMEVDELDGEDGEQTGGKRKKAAAPKKPAAKKAKTESKAKPDSDAPKKAKAAAKKTEEPDSQPAAAPEPAGDEDPLASDPICVKVKGWRHILQRAFLGKELPTAGEMTAHDETFKKIEAYDDMTIQALQYSKIGKVMKKISTLEDIPRDDELKIRERAAKLMNDWHAFIEKEQAAGSQTNGDKE